MRMFPPPDTGRNLLTKDPEILKTEECQGLTEPLAPTRDHVIETPLVPFNAGAGSGISNQAVYVFPLVITPKNIPATFASAPFFPTTRTGSKNKF